MHLFIVTNKDVVKGAAIGTLTFCRVEKNTDQPPAGQVYIAQVSDFESIWYGHPTNSSLIPAQQVFEELDGLEEWSSSDILGNTGCKESEASHSKGYRQHQ